MPDRHVIANKALGYLGANRIASFEAGTTEADQVRDNYEDCVRQCLQDCPWNFAHEEKRLAQDLTRKSLAFDYSYALPIDCISPRWLQDEEGRVAYFDYRILRKKLCTNLTPAFLAYTCRAGEADFDPLFTSAVEHLLASKMAFALTETEAKAEAHQKLYREHLAIARSRNGQQDMPERMDTSILISAHRG